MVGKGQTAGTCDHRMESHLAILVKGLLKKVCKGFLNVGEMALVICENKIFILVQNRDFYSSGTNVNSKCFVIHKVNSSLLVLYINKIEIFLLLFTHHYSARCFDMNMPKSRDIQAKIPLPQAIWNEFWLRY